jgi:hypothetical protein
MEGTVQKGTSCVKNTVYELSLCESSRARGFPVLEEHRFPQDLHGTTSQKTAFFIVTAVKTSNPTCYVLSPFKFSS